MPLNSLKIPQEFECSLSHEIMVDPVFVIEGGVGYTYEREAITAWFQKHNTNPSTGNVLQSKELVTNVNLKGQISSFIQTNIQAFKQELQLATKKGDRELVALLIKLKILHTADAKQYLLDILESQQVQMLALFSPYIGNKINDLNIIIQDQNLNVSIENRFKEQRDVLGKRVYKLGLIADAMKKAIPLYPHGGSSLRYPLYTGEMVGLDYRDPKATHAMTWEAYMQRELEKISALTAAASVSEISLLLGIPAATRINVDQKLKNELTSLCSCSDLAPATLETMYNAHFQGAPDDNLRVYSKWCSQESTLRGQRLTPLLNAITQVETELRNLEIEEQQYSIQKKSTVHCAAIHLAIKLNNLPLIQQLMIEGGNLSVCDIQGWNGLHYAIRYGNTALCEALKVHEIGINSQDLLGNTALHIAVMRGAEDLIEWLIMKGGDPYLKNQKQQSAWDLATLINSPLADAIKLKLQVKQLLRKETQDLHKIIQNLQQQIVALEIRFSNLNLAQDVQGDKITQKTKEEKLLHRYSYYCNLEARSDITISPQETLLLSQYKLGKIERTKDLYHQLPSSELKKHIEEKYITKPNLNKNSSVSPSSSTLDRTAVRAKKLFSK